MARAFRATFVTRVGNAIVTALLRSGVNLGRMTLLTVPGRKSGLARTTPWRSSSMLGGATWHRRTAPAVEFRRDAHPS